MFGRPKQWQAMLVWIRNYGNNRLIRTVAIRNTKERQQHVSMHAHRIHADLAPASRHRLKHQIPCNPFSGNSSRKDTAKKHPPDTIIHRPLRFQNFKAQGSKSRGKIGPSILGLTSLTLSDVEEEGRKGQILYKSDPTGSAEVSTVEIAADGIVGSEATNEEYPRHHHRRIHTRLHNQRLRSVQIVLTY